MKILKSLLFVFLFTYSAFSQMNRIAYNNQELFLSGANLPWINFANDIGPGSTDTIKFGDIMLDMHEHGGNALRWWLHTDGTSTPEFDGNSDSVIGPGQNTIADLKHLLDMAWQREIGMNLCLWSFDMLRSDQPVNVLARNTLLLTDTNYTRAYINNCLVPMVDSLKGHPGILAWEIFNEPEGMSNEFGWSHTEHVPMSAIQRFINLCAGAIHRVDSTAQVTIGSWSFQANSDVGMLSPASQEFSQLNSLQKEKITELLNQKYNFKYTTEEFINYLDKISEIQNYNYYSDQRLIAQGGDSLGTLDFYSPQYYVWLGSAYSPFVHPSSYWLLDKSMVIGEFAMLTTDGIPKKDLFLKLYQSGYAGALPWSWTVDNQLSAQEDIIAAMQYMWDNYQEDVDVDGIAGKWPTITITMPDSNDVITDTTEIEIVTNASDEDGYISFVEFFANDDLIGVVDTVPFTLSWMDVPSGNYILKAIATDNDGHVTVSNLVPIQVGVLAMARLEGETADLHGSGMTVGNDPIASGGAYLDIKSNDTTNTITWTLPDVPEAGNYHIVFGFKLEYGSPKEQFINVNGVRVDTIRFEGNTNLWLETGTDVDLVQGENTIQMQLFWGWMQIDYLGVPKDIVSAVEDSREVPFSYSLDQNYPNPFNPVTNINYTLANTELVKLNVYDILGRKVVTLINETQNAGAHIVEFDASNLASGIYFYRIEAGSFRQVNKMMLLK